MKKAVCIITILLTAVSFLCGCSLTGEKPALVILGTDIGRDIYDYYYDKVDGRPGDYGLSDSPKNSEKRDAAINLCRKYLALNTSFVYHGLSLSASDKVSVSDNVNNHWMRFGKHYEEIGVSKQTLTKIFTSEAYEDEIFTAMYDKGTGNAEGEKQTKNYFNTHYVAFSNVCVYFTNSDGTSITEAEKQEIVSKFNSVRENSGTDYDSFANAAAEAGYTASGTIILSSSSEGYPEGFFESVYDQDDGSVKIITYGNCIFAVRKQNLEDLGDAVYSSYREACIEEMYADQWHETLDSYIERFTVDEINV